MGPTSELPLTNSGIADSLVSLGIKPGELLFMHSSLSSLGPVEGGANTVVDALLEVLGTNGTLVVPTFNGSIRKSNQPFDPNKTPSEVGSITECVRNRPDSFRSRHLWQSMAAVGERAKEMMSVHRPTAWAGDGPFWKLYEWDARILLLGVPYFRSTFWHFIEQMVQPAYGMWKESTGRIKNTDGTYTPLKERTFGPKPGYYHDFNKLGSKMESLGRVRIGTIGNAIARLYLARDALDIGIAEYRKDPWLLVKTGPNFTQLNDGFIVGEYNNEKSVVDPKGGYKLYE